MPLDWCPDNVPLHAAGVTMSICIVRSVDDVDRHIERASGVMCSGLMPDSDFAVGVPGVAGVVVAPVREREQDSNRDIQRATEGHQTISPRQVNLVELQPRDLGLSYRVGSIAHALG